MKKLTLLLWIVLLSGCSTKFAYNNIDWLVNWYIDDYVVLDTQQEKQFDAILDKWTAWLDVASCRNIKHISLK